MDEQKNELDTESAEEQMAEPIEEAVTEKPRNRKVALIFAIVLGIVLPAVLVVLGIVIESSGLFGIFFIFALLSLLAGIVALVFFCRLGRKKDERDATKTRKSAIPFVALALELCTAPTFLLTSILPFFWGLFICLGILMPFAGIVLGIAALNLDKDQINVVGKVFAWTSIFLPPLTILVFIVLFSSGVLVFALM